MRFGGFAAICFGLGGGAMLPLERVLFGSVFLVLLPLGTLSLCQ